MLWAHGSGGLQVRLARQNMIDAGFELPGVDLELLQPAGRVVLVGGEPDMPAPAQLGGVLQGVGRQRLLDAAVEPRRNVTPVAWAGAAVGA